MEWLSKKKSPWGIEKNRFGKWEVFFDHEMRATSSLHKSKRRAKKEVRYIEAGCHRGPFHGANKAIKTQNWTKRDLKDG